MALTYTTLVQAIKDYTDNTETTFVSQIDQFIANAEDRILYEVQLPDFRTNATGNITKDIEFLQMPTDWIAPFSISIVLSNQYYFLLQKDVNFLQEAYPITTEKGRPLYYAIYDTDNFLLRPVPDIAYTAEIHYFYRPTGLSGSTATTWISTYAADALLYACLIEAYVFMKGDQELMLYYNTRYGESISRLKNLGEGRMRKDVYEDGQLRIPVT
jgi:hypothetical protein